jgi:hypothetical protein
MSGALTSLWRRITSSRILPWVLAAVFLVTTLVNWWLLHDERNEDSHRAAVTSTAEGFIHAFTNYRADEIEKDVAAIQGYAVGAFASQLKDTFDDAAIARIKANDVQATGTIWNLEVHDLSGDQAHVRSLVYETVAKKGSATTTDAFQLEIELLRSGDEWKVDRVQANILQPPAAGSG